MKGGNRTDEEYLEWFYQNHELNKEKYERIVIDGEKHLPAIEIERS